MTTESTDEIASRLLLRHARIGVCTVALGQGESHKQHIHWLTTFFVIASGQLIRFAGSDGPADSQDVPFIDEVVRVAVGPADTSPTV